jgi:hypothetical protein
MAESATATYRTNAPIEPATACPRQRSFLPKLNRPGIFAAP